MRILPRLAIAAFSAIQKSRSLLILYPLRAEYPEERLARGAVAQSIFELFLHARIHDAWDLISFGTTFIMR